MRNRLRRSDRSRRLFDDVNTTARAAGLLRGRRRVLDSTPLFDTALEGHELDGPLAPAAELLALVAGQDVEAGEDGVFRIARKVARDRLISTVDVAASHGHKSRARTFDGHKTHLWVDPDDELITNVAVTAANTPDRQVLGELLDEPGTGEPAADTESTIGEPAGNTGDDSDSDSQGDLEPKDFEVYGDSACADGATLDEQAQRATTCAPKCPRCATQMAIPKTTSASTWPPAPSPARPITPWPSATAAATAQPASASSVSPARYRRPAPQPVGDGSSASTPMKPLCSTPRAAQKDRPGSRPTGPTAPSWNARSATSPTAPGTAEKPDAADTPAS
jgi:hypothetical protein